jgi:hypothetical protein
MRALADRVRALRRLVALHPGVASSVAGCVAVVAALAVTLALVSQAAPAPAKSVAAVKLRPVVRVTPKPKPKKKKGPLLDPFTGEPVKSLGRVLAVKIDNIVYARPQTGLGDADIIYVIPVEGGLTRFMAVFSSHIPPVVGPVRSARQSDLDLLQQFGRPAFAWSGATPHLVPFVERARIVDLYDELVGGYFRSSDRVAPYNLYANTPQVMREAPKASKARDIGFRFGALPPGGTPRESYTVNYPATTFTFRWSARDKRWLVWMDGAPGMTTDTGQLGGSTVIIQYTWIGTSRFEEYGGRPPLAESTGSGRAVILRNGRAYTVHWSRPNANDGTTFTLPDGRRMLFAPGQVWVVLAPEDHDSYENAAAT